MSSTITDFTLVLYSPALCRKTDSYVNKEIALARERDAQRPRPLSDSASYRRDLRPRTASLSCANIRRCPCGQRHFDEDMEKVISSMRREYQRRRR